MNSISREVPLRPITSTAEYNRATAVIEKLALRPKLSRGQQDYLDALIIFAQAFDAAEPDIADDVSPVDMVKALMEHQGMTAGGLGKVLGSKSTASEILHGKRGISKSQIAKLAAFFSG